VRWGDLVKGSIADESLLDKLLGEQAFDAVLHFAARSLVGESMKDPAKYYSNNLIGTITLLDAMRRHGISKFIFSSTAAIFGDPIEDLIDEAHPTRPVNPYGASKLMVERVLADYATAYGFNSVALRYFNAAGADPSAMIGESHTPETHLIPNLVKSVAGGRREPVSIFGLDYPTPDGTCVRDYVHVNDLCAAHLSALEFLDDSSGFHAFNLGNGHGYSVKQVVTAVEAVVGENLNVIPSPRRPGDPARLVASGKRARELLGWQPLITDIRAIIESAWRWHLNPAY